MKIIITFLSIILTTFSSVSYAAEKDSKAQVTFENEYISKEEIHTDNPKENSKNNQQFEKLPRTNEEKNDWITYGALIFFGSLWLIQRRNNK